MLNRVTLIALLLVTIAGCAMEREGAVAAGGDYLTSHPYFDVFEAQNGDYYFNLHAANHEVILQSQGYSTRSSAINGALSVMDNGEILSRYEMQEAANGEWYFTLDARNGRVIGMSETYTTRSNAERGIDTVIRNVGAYLDWQANRVGRRFDVFRGNDGRYYFNLIAGNGEIVLSSQGYASEASAINGTFSVAANGTTEARYELNDSADGGAYFNLTATNGQVIGTSEVYSSRSNAQRACNGIIELLPTVDLL